MNETKSGTLPIARDLFSQIGKSLLMAVPPIRRWRLSLPRTSHNLNDLDAYLRDGAFLSLNLLLEHAGGVKGKSVCEIGPGDFLSSGLSILAAGAKQYIVIDRFPGNYYGKTAKGLYNQIAANWNKYFPDLTWDVSIDARCFPEMYEDRVCLIGEPLEKVKLSEQFDIVCSFQVGEHVSDIRAFAQVHSDLLKTDGVGLHRVDFGPHDVWSQYRDPMTFLRFPEILWRLTGANRGIPNRCRYHEFIEAFEEAGLDVEVIMTESFDENLVNYEKLDRRFRQMPRESLLVKTAIFSLKLKQAM